MRVRLGIRKLTHEVSDTIQTGRSTKSITILFDKHNSLAKRTRLSPPQPSSICMARTTLSIVAEKRPTRSD